MTRDEAINFILICGQNKVFGHGRRDVAEWLLDIALKAKNTSDPDTHLKNRLLRADYDLQHADQTVRLLQSIVFFNQIENERQ